MRDLSGEWEIRVAEVEVTTKYSSTWTMSARIDWLATFTSPACKCGEEKKEKEGKEGKEGWMMMDDDG